MLPDTDSRAELFNRNVALARFLANRFVRLNADKLRASGLERQDVHQLALVALWRASNVFDPARGVRFGAHAGVVVWRDLLGILREMRRPRVRIQTGAAAAIDFEAGGTDPADVANERDVARRIRRALRRLPPSQRRAIVGRWFRVKTLAAIASDEGVSPQRIQQRVSAGLARLRKILAGDECDDGHGVALT